MPPKKESKGSSSLRQTTLFHSPTSSSFVNQRLTRSKAHSGPSSSPSKREEVTHDSSSDEIGGIHFAPVKTVSKRISSEDESVPRPPRAAGKRRRTRLSSASVSDHERQLPLGVGSDKQDFHDSDDEDEPSPRKKGRLLCRRHSLEKKVPSDSGEEDTQQLANEVDREQILDSRLRIRNKKTAFQKNLEKLKRHKLRKNDAEEETEEEEEEEEEEPNMKPFKGSKPSGERDSDSDGEQSSSSNSSNFIVEDDGVVQLPAQFSMETHQDLSHQFKKIFQFFVHIVVEPPENRSTFMESRMQDEEYFSVPLQVTRRKLLGLRDSLVASSVWRPGFKKSLETYPDFELVSLDFAVPSCDACHLGGRMSTLLGRLSGCRYNKFGFEEMAPDDDEEEDEKEFHLGRFCAKRTKVYHQFSHWEYSLFQSILGEVDELRSSSSSRGFQRVAYFRAQNPPADLEDADLLCDWLDERKIIDMEWQKLKTMMESARHLEIKDRRGEDYD